MGLGSIGPAEWIIIFLVLLLFFGANKLPELARGLGKSIKEFKKATKEVEKELDQIDDEDKDKK
ncbi:twin-arginine translocase TatA/TatE family subunit [candidate division KSB1 bacterium]|nr:MAG: twin-arginine translocase TatA/TatE family subunit [candidate division KSB1 bacterium]